MVMEEEEGMIMEEVDNNCQGSESSSNNREEGRSILQQPTPLQHESGDQAIVAGSKEIDSQKKMNALNEVADTSRSNSTSNTIYDNTKLQDSNQMQVVERSENNEEYDSKCQEEGDNTIGISSEEESPRKGFR